MDIYSCKGFFCWVQNMGRTTLFQSIKIQNLAYLPFSNMDLVWKNRFRNGGQNKATIQTTYILYIQVPKILEGG
jgi:hypothetical protein